MKKRTKKKIVVVTNADKRRIQEAYQRKFAEYAALSLEDCHTLLVSNTIKGSYLRALNDATEFKEANLLAEKEKEATND